MMFNNNVKKDFLFLLIFSIFCTSAIFAQAEKSNQPHTKQIGSVAFMDGTFFTGADDGCIIKWTSDGIGEHYQVSDLGIKLLTIHPNGYEIAIYETDGFSVHRISVWNWKTKTRKFAKRFTDSITFLSYTSTGNYLMAGTTSVDGLLFLNVQNGTPLSVVQDNTGIVTNAKNGTTKIVTYEKQGSLNYYSMTEGNKIAQFKCEDNLNNTFFVHRNGRYLVGTKDNSIFIVDATTGKTSKVITADKPMILSSDDDEFYYIENDKENFCLSLKRVELSKNENQFQETLIKPFEFSETNSDISAVNKAIALENTAYFCMNNGSIYSLGMEIAEETAESTMYTDKIDHKISDIEIIDEDYYLLVNSKLLKGSIMSPNTEFLENINSSNITVTKNKELILWTKNDVLPVSVYKNGELQELFTPSLPITSLNVSSNSSPDNKIIITTGNQTVSIYDFEKAHLEDIYTGTGLQDAILVGNVIYASKTSLTAPNSALISIDTATKETVPLPVTGQVIFNLNQRKIGEGSTIIYGISNGLKEGKRHTEIFSFNTDTKKYTPQLQWGDEDTSAFLRFISGIMYTNIGKTNTRTLDLSNKKTSQLKRAAFLPKKIAGNKSFLVTLNQDGSLTWYEAGTNTRLETWHYCADNYLLSR